MSSIAGVNIICNQSIIDQSGYSEMQRGYKTTLLAGCTKEVSEDKYEHYTLLIQAFGIALRPAGFSAFAMTCPTVSSKRLDRKKKVSLGTIRVGADLHLGANISVALNHRGGTCFIGGFDFYSIGAELTLGKMTLFKGQIHEHEELRRYIPEFAASHD